MAEVDLGAEVEGGGGPLQKGGEVLLHELHEDGEACGPAHVRPEVLHDVRVSQ